MQKITAYFGAPVRGKDGENVSDEVKAENVKRGIRIGQLIRQIFPDLDLYIPHEHEEVIHELWRNGIAGDEIVKATTSIALKKDFGIFYTGHGTSEGMAKEMKAMEEAGIPGISMDTAFPLAALKIQRQIKKLRND